MLQGSHPVSVSLPSFAQDQFVNRGESNLQHNILTND